MRPRFDEGRAEVWITNLSFERLTQRVAVQCYAEAFLVEALRNRPGRYLSKLIDFFCHSLPQFGCKTRCETMGPLMMWGGGWYGIIFDPLIVILVFAFRGRGPSRPLGRGARDGPNPLPLAFFIQQ